MTERLPITKAQAKTLTQAAKDSGCVIEVEANGMIWRVIPTAHEVNKPKLVAKNNVVSL